MLLATFIASSIAYQKRQIGILRALGSSGGSVYLTFQVEAWLLVGVASLLGCIAAAIAAHYISLDFIQRLGASFSVFPFSIWVVLIVVGFALAVSSLACAIPCALAARKKPVDLIAEE